MTAFSALLRRTEGIQYRMQSSQPSPLSSYAARSSTGLAAFAEGRAKSPWERYLAMLAEEENDRPRYHPPLRDRLDLPPGHPYAASPEGTASGHETLLPHYLALGIDDQATLPQIEQAYRQQVALVHPDKYAADPERRSAAEEKLKTLNVAIRALRSARETDGSRASRPGSGSLTSRLRVLAAQP